MGGRIMGRDRSIPAFAQHGILPYDERADGHFPLGLGAGRELERAPHPGFVTAHSHSIVAGGLPEMS